MDINDVVFGDTYVIIQSRKGNVGKRIIIQKRIGRNLYFIPEDRRTFKGDAHLIKADSIKPYNPKPEPIDHGWL